MADKKSLAFVCVHSYLKSLNAGIIPCENDIDIETDYGRQKNIVATENRPGPFLRDNQAGDTDRTKAGIRNY